MAQLHGGRLQVGNRDDGRGAALAAARLRRLHGNSIDSPHGDPKPAIAAPQTFRHHPDGESPMNRTLAYKLGAIAYILLLLIPC